MVVYYIAARNPTLCYLAVCKQAVCNQAVSNLKESFNGVGRIRVGVLSNGLFLVTMYLAATHPFSAAPWLVCLAVVYFAAEYSCKEIFYISVLSTLLKPGVDVCTILHGTYDQCYFSS